MPTKKDAERVAAVDWFHTIDLGGGLVTAGTSAHIIDESLFPSLQGKSVLDIGAWDGRYSFEAERLGARRVVALDHYVWCIDWAARQAYWDKCDAEGVLPDLRRDERDFWLPDTMPGKRGFDVAHDILGSKVESIVADFMTIDLDTFDSFDVVFYFGVLYHVREPLTALERLRAVTNEVAVIETEAIAFADPNASLLAFYPGSELRADHTNWYAPTERALHGMCRAAGFTRVETKSNVPQLTSPATTRSWRARTRVEPDDPSMVNYRLLVHAYA